MRKNDKNERISKMTEEKNKYAEAVYKKWNNGIDKAFGGASPKDRLLMLASNAATAFTSFVFTVTPLKILGKALGFPLMYAYVCASGRFSLGAFGGAFYGLFKSSASVTEYIALLAVMLIRFVGWRYLNSERKLNGIFTESAPMRAAACALLCMLRSAMRLALGELSNEAWISILLTLTAAPIICIAMLFYFSGEHRLKGIRRFAYYISMTSLFSLTVYCASNIRYIGGNVGVMTAVFLTLAVSNHGGALAGGSMGALLGALTGLQNTVPLALIGTSSGIFFSLGALSAAGISVTLGAVSAVLMNGIGAVTGFIPEAVISVAISSPVLKYGFLPTDFPFPQAFNSARNAELQKHASLVSVKSGCDRLLKLSSAFSELSESIDSNKNDLHFKVANSIRDNFCESCPMSPICWETEQKNAYLALTALSGLYLSGNFDVQTNMPPWLSERCVRLKELCSETEHNALELKKTANENTFQNSSEFLSISEILEDIAHNTNEEIQNDDELSKKIIRTVNTLGHRVHAATVLGSSRKQVYLYGINKPKSSEDIEKLRKTVSEICGEELSQPIFSEGTATLSAARKFCTESSHAEETKDGEPCSGDRTVSFTTDDGCFYSLITDGMGSGSEASECSQYACVLLEKLLRCNIKKTVAVRILGELLQKRFKECFTTVDIMKFDLMSGQTNFLKSGAANSYIIRGGAVYCVSSRTMPIGISSDAFPEESEFELRDGDTVVMMSDGVASEPSDGVWLTRALSSGDLKSPSVLARELLSNAIENRGRSDDMTVSVIKISLAS